MSMVDNDAPRHTRPPSGQAAHIENALTALTRAGLVSQGELPVPFKVHKQQIDAHKRHIAELQDRLGIGPNNWRKKVEQLETEVELLGADLRRAETKAHEARMPLYELRHTLMKVRAQLTRARRFLRRCTPHPDDERAVKRLLKTKRP